MGVKHTVQTASQSATVASTVFAQPYGPKVKETEIGIAPFAKDGGVGGGGEAEDGEES